MRLVHAIYSSPWSPLAGGGQLAVHAMAGAMQELGHETEVIYSRLPGEGPPATVPYRFELTPYRGAGEWNFDACEHAAALLRRLRTRRYDCVFGHSVNAVFFPDVCRRFGVPFVYVFHGRWLPAPEARPWRRWAQTAKHFDYRLVQRALEAADEVVTFSEWAKELVATRTRRPGATIRVLRPGIEPEWFDVAREPRGAFTVLHWGRLESLKGIDTLLRAFQRVRAEVPDARLVIAGTGPSEQELRGLAAELGLGSHVEWLGLASPSRIRERCRSAHVAVFPTLVESFGLAIAEACAARIPVIASRTGSVPELVEHGVTGTLTTVGDVSELAGAIIDVARNPQLSSSRVEPNPVVKGLSWLRLGRELLERSG